MGKKLTAKDKIGVIEVFLPLIKNKIAEATERLQQAQEDWLNLYGVDGDKSKVTKNPIFSVVEGQVSVEILGKLITDVERVLGE